MKYIAQSDGGGVFEISAEKVHEDAAWDGLHAIVSNDWQTSSDVLLARYRRWWVIEDAFRRIKQFGAASHLSFQARAQQGSH